MLITVFGYLFSYSSYDDCQIKAFSFCDCIQKDDDNDQTSWVKFREKNTQSYLVGTFFQCNLIFKQECAMCVVLPVSGRNLRCRMLVGTSDTGVTAVERLLYVGLQSLYIRRKGVQSSIKATYLA